MMRLVKTNSSAWINKRGFLNRKFQWQRGFGVFSVGYSQVETVEKYIINQEKHHSKTTFQEEYLSLLDQHFIEFREEYLFDWIMD